MEMETAIITRTGHGYEVTDSFGGIIGSFREWRQVAEMFRRQDFSEEYIAKRKTDLERSSQTRIDETNE
jgi:hypothetical protein